LRVERRRLHLLGDEIAHGVADLDLLGAETKIVHAACSYSMIPKKPAPDLIRGGYRFSEKIMLQQ
jgi:hypothetical protein